MHKKAKSSGIGLKKSGRVAARAQSLKRRPALKVANKIRSGGGK